MSNESESGVGPPEAGPAPAHREVHYEYSRDLAPLLTRLGASLVVSTYQAGKLVVVGVDPHGGLALSGWRPPAGTTPASWPARPT
jgi:hypothetical protein